MSDNNLDRSWRQAFEQAAERDRKQLGIVLVAFAAGVLPWYLDAPLLVTFGIPALVYVGLHLSLGIKIRWWG